MSNEIAVIEPREVAPLSAEEVISQVQLIQRIMAAVMKEGDHYGVIPGTEKPTLLKPGAEKLCVTFRLAPVPVAEEVRDLGNGHREVTVKLRLEHIPTGRMYGYGVGSCSTMESKYRYRKSERECPHCGKETIIKGRPEYGGGWLCYSKKGGCGEKFLEDDPVIKEQMTGRKENPDLADQYNVTLKMAFKRAYVAATLTATAASDLFHQDLEEMAENEDASGTRKTVVPPPAPTQQRPAQSQQQPPQQSSNLRLITKGQLDILLLSQRRNRIPDATFKQYLKETFDVVESKDIKQRDLNTILEWMELYHVHQVEAEERKGMKDEAAHA